MPFRDAHGVVGRLVRRSVEGSEDLTTIVDAELGPEAAALLQPGVAVTRRTTAGGAGPVPVARQIELFRSHLAAERVRVGGLV